MEMPDTFRKLMQEYDAVLDRLLSLGHRKIRIIASGESAGLDGCMREEEAEMLRMRGLDQKRQRLQKDMNLEGKSFREILEFTAAEQGPDPELQSLCTQLQEKTRLMKELSASISSMIQSRLTVVERIISEGQETAGDYGRDGKQKEPEQAPRMRPRSV